MSIPIEDPVIPVCFIYKDYNTKGKTLVVTKDISDFRAVGFNDKASSCIISKGEWAFYEHINYEGKKIVLGPGTYTNLYTLGNDTVSSVKLEK